jgi:hypothetical protein
MRKSAILGLILMAGAALASAATKHSTAGITLTGCLQKGDEPNTFLLTNATGTGVKADRWELVGAPASLKMSDHVGHKVEVHGSSVSEATAEKLEHEKGAMKEPAKEKEKEKGEHHLHVKSLKHISPTCP